jgi:DNA-binding NtrC family response regulator
MAPSLQAKLLRALQEHEIRRVGGERTIRVNARVVAATNRDLRGAIEAGTFREDLYFRLGAFVITVPPLRERREAIPALAQEFLRRAAARFKKDVRTISPAAMTLLVGYPWPGNVRELEHAVERGVILAADTRITPAELPAEVRVRRQAARSAGGSLDVRRNERALIEEALQRFRGNRRKAAEALNMSTVTLWRRLRQYGLSGPDDDTPTTR